MDIQNLHPSIYLFILRMVSLRSVLGVDAIPLQRVHLECWHGLIVVCIEGKKKKKTLVSTSRSWRIPAVLCPSHSHAQNIWHNLERKDMDSWGVLRCNVRFNQVWLKVRGISSTLKANKSSFWRSESFGKPKQGCQYSMAVSRASFHYGNAHKEESQMNIARRPETKETSASFGKLKSGVTNSKLFVCLFKI